MEPRSKLIAPLFAVLLFPVAACGQTSVGVKEQGSVGVRTGKAVSIQARLTSDCVAPACSPIVIQGENTARLPNGMVSPFSGMADPSMRKDPASNRIWLAYSWPNMHILGMRQHVASVDTHLAYSDDGGNTWKFRKSLWPSVRTTNKGGANQTGYMSQETPNLLPVQKGDAVTWYAARLEYFVPDTGYRTMPVTSFQLNVMQAASPEALANAPVQVLGTSVTAGGWGVDVNLAALSPATKKCEIWNEPALYWQDDTLYMGTFCQTYIGRTIDESQSDFEIFSTPARGDVKSWKWSYVGAMINGSIAREFGQPGATQFEIAKGVSGQLLAIFSPYHWDSAEREMAHEGCVAVEIASIDPPALARDSSGKLKVEASIMASDQGPLGPAACTYDPASATGILITKRIKNSSEFISTVNVTKVRP